MTMASSKRFGLGLVTMSYGLFLVGIHITYSIIRSIKGEPHS